MWRSLVQLIKGRRIRSEEVTNDPLGEQSDRSLVIIHEVDASQSQTGSDIVNAVRTHSLLASQSLEEVKQGPDKAAVSQHVAELVEVDLSVQSAVSNSVNTSMQILSSDDRLNKGKCAIVLSAASTSSLQDTSLAHTGHTSTESCTIRNTLQTPLEKDVLQSERSQLELVSTSNASFCQQGSSKHHEADLGSANNGTIPRTLSTFSADSLAEYCRICQQPSDEPLIELGCHCRGDLAKTHRSCVQEWFKNKGSNKCEVCQHVATNLPPPASQPLQSFWAWRPYAHRPLQRWQGRGSFHPLLAALLILTAGLLFDILISYYLGASALPVNIIIGVLAVLGLGTAGRLLVECWHERRIRRSITRMEMDADMDHLQSGNGFISIHLSS